MKRKPSQQNDYDVFANAEHFVVTKYIDHWQILSRTEVNSIGRAVEVAAEHKRSLIYAVTKEGRFACMTLEQLKDFLNETRTS